MYSVTLSLTSTLDEVGCHRPAPTALPRERPSTNFTGGWVGPRTGLDGHGKSRLPPGFDPRTVQPRSESLYRLSYPGPTEDNKTLQLLQAFCSHN
jgi:hypothetical protein